MSVEYDFEKDAEILKLAKSDPENALKLANELIDEFPTSARAWASKSYVYTINKQYSKALESINFAIRIDPEEPVNYFDAGRINLRLTKYEDSIKFFEKCLILSGVLANSYYDSSSHMHICYCKCRLGFFSDAEKHLSFVLDEEILWAGRIFTKEKLKEICIRSTFSGSDR